MPRTHLPLPIIAPRDTGSALIGTVTDRAAMAARFTRDVPRFVQVRETVEQAHARIRERLQQREARLLTFLRRSIFEQPDGPYRDLFQHAGCEYGDVVRLVQQDGVEQTLTTLAERGVYLTYDEYAGRRDLVRGSFRRRYADTDFDNPLIVPHFLSQTGGSGGRAKSLRQSLKFGVEICTDFAATLDAHGVRDAAFVFWMGAPINWLLTVPRVGGRTVAWCYPLHDTPWSYALGARYLSFLARLGGARIPAPQFLDIQHPERMARLLADQLRRETSVVLSCPVSSSVRVALAAREAGISLAGLNVIAMSEPTTAERRRHLEAVGARVLTRYSTMESGPIAAGCATPTAPDDGHIFLDRFALIDRPTVTRSDGLDVPSLLATNLGQHELKVLFNAELGDYGRREVRSPECCDLGRLGLTTHIWDVRSFEKLSSEGVSFVRSQIEQIIEQVLPSQFGGTAMDYQLVEEAGPDGNLRLALCASPDCGQIDDDRLRAAFLAALAAGTAADRYQALLLARAESLVVRREWPQVTHGGKMLPFHARRAAHQGASRR